MAAAALPEFSYHIAMGYGVKVVGGKKEADGTVMVWPACGFGQYCTTLAEAETQLQAEIKEAPEKVHQLIRLTAVRHPVSQKVIGVREPQLVLQTYLPPKNQKAT